MGIPQLGFIISMVKCTFRCPDLVADVVLLLDLLTIQRYDAFSGPLVAVDRLTEQHAADRCARYSLVPWLV